MLLIAELILTITAWRRGWRWWALMPLGLGMIIAFFMGMTVGVCSGIIDDVSGLYLLLDLFCTIALIVLNIRKPKSIRDVRYAEPKGTAVAVRG